LFGLKLFSTLPIKIMKTSTHRKLALLAGAVVTALFAGCASSGVKNPSGVPVTEMKADERGPRC